MKRASLAVAVLVALTLTGCAGTPQSAPSEPEQAPTGTSEQTPEESAAPATVEPTEPTDPKAEAEAWFLDYAGIAQLDLPDDEKIAAGYYACEQVGAGNMEVVALEGVSVDDNIVFVDYALTALCPENSEAYLLWRQSRG